jgi:hypothetical protein
MNVIPAEEALACDDVAVECVLLNANREDVVLARWKYILIGRKEVLIVKSIVLGRKCNGSPQVIVGYAAAHRECAATGPALSASISVFTVPPNKVLLDLSAVVIDIAIAHQNLGDAAITLPAAIANASFVERDLVVLHNTNVRG